VAAPRLTDEEFARIWNECGGSPAAVRNATGLLERSVYARRKSLARRGIVLHSTEPLAGAQGNPNRRWSALGVRPDYRLNLDVVDGVVLVFSDAHYWPGVVSVSHRALLALIAHLKPAIVIANGDILDGATISRHPRSGWEQRPTMAQELKVCQDRMGEIEAAGALARCKHFVWDLGNHDARFENYLSANAPGAEGLPGTTLPEHFPRWQFAISTVLNAGSDHPVMVKHRYHNGIHATYNNALKAGISIVTSHLHRLNITSWGDYRGRRYGVDTGTLASPYGPQFNYTEDAPTPAGEGFAVLTFREGRLQPPELVEVVDGVAIFRGEPVNARAAA
jgi:hypothetical protein